MNPVSVQIPFKVAKWGGDYPEVDPLVSKQLLLYYLGYWFEGQYHCNGCFYPVAPWRLPFVMLNHSKYGHNESVHWCYLDEIKVPIDLPV